MAGTIDPKKLLPEIEQLNTALNSTVNALNKNNELLKNTNEQIKKKNTTQKESIENTNKYKVSLDVLAKSEGEIAKIQDNYNKLLAKTKAERSEQAKKLIKLQELRKKQNKAIRDEVKLEGTAKDSLVRKRAELSKLIQQYDRGSSTLRTKLNPQITKLTKEVSKAEQATGRHQRNVGNYRDALNNLPGSFGRAAGGARMLGAQFKALLKNPVVLVIAAIVGAVVLLKKAFTSSDAGATEFAARMEQVKVIVDVLRQRLIDLTKVVSVFFDKSKTWKERAEAVKDVFKGTADQLKNATDAAYEYQYALDVLADAETNYLSESAKNRLEIAKLEFSAQDRTKSTKERKKALEDAIKIGEEELLRQKEFADRRFEEELKYTAAKYNINQDLIRRLVEANDVEADALMKNNKEVADFRNKLGDENAKKLEEFYAKSIQLETAFFKEQKRNISRLSGFQEELNKKREQAQKFNDKLRSDGFKDIQDSLDKLDKENDDYFVKLMNNEIDAANTVIDLTNKVHANKKQKHEEELQMLREKLGATEQYGNQILDIAAQFLEAEAMQLDNKLAVDNARAEEKAAQELLIVGDNAEAQTQINDKLTKEKEANEQKYQDEIKKIKRKQAISEKIGAMFNAGVNTAVAITKVLANPVLLPIVTALGAFQIAAIAATPIPKFKKGLKNNPVDRFGIVGDGGREIINMPDGTSYLANKETMMYLPKGADVVTNYETEKQLSSNFNDNNIVSELVKTRKAISENVTYQDLGDMHRIQKRNEVQKHLDKYYRGLN